MYELTIIGGGPAGITAGVYAARKKLKTLFITKEWGGQSTVSDDIQNWIGTPHISGQQLAKNLKEHLLEYKGEDLDIIDNALAKNVSKTDEGFSIMLDSGDTIETKTILIASGSKRRELPIKGAAEFNHKGLTYCATCDGPLFGGRDLVVIGGGNAAFETAAQLLAYAKSVTLINRTDTFRADAVTVEKLRTHENMNIITDTELLEVVGDAMVTGLRYKDTATGEEKELATGGIFVEIGHVPNTDFIAGLVELNGHKKVITDPRRQTTSTEGIWAAGDCTDSLYQQNNIASGDAVKALEDIYGYLRVR